MRRIMQELIVDDQGVCRFRANKIIRHLLEHGQRTGCGLNELAVMTFSNEDRRQLAQLIGYSLCGFHELDYVDDASALAASAEAKKIDPAFGGCRDGGCVVHSGMGQEDAP